MAATQMPGTARLLVTSLSVWLTFGLMGSLFPCGIRLLVITMSNVDVTIREMFGYSTLILIASGIFVSSFGDIFVDRDWARIGGGFLAFGFILCLITGPLIGVAAVFDVSREFKDPAGLNDWFWIWGELAAIFVLIVFGSSIKTKLWLLSLEGRHT